MHSFNNLFAEKTRKKKLWRVYLKAIVRKYFEHKTSATVKLFFIKMHSFINPLSDINRKTLFWRMCTNAIIRIILNSKKMQQIRIL